MFGIESGGTPSRKRTKKQRRREQRRRLFLEQLEDRRLLAANVAVTGLTLIDGGGAAVPISGGTGDAEPILGERLIWRVDFDTTDLPAAAKYDLNATLNGVTVTTEDLTNGAGVGGTRGGRND
ncbi:MAG: hypothetical protein QGG36_22330 [Pirellulaceae bacterium]|jgi:hypothetical protein|nr:hypothetical protein [Pirellulaceae bacterium]MDP7018553.1 hypothetical protein [Pirellulaceae bacterium]